MTKKDKIIMCIFSFLLVFVTLLANVKFLDIFALPQNFKTNYSEIDEANKSASFGGFVKTEFEERETEVGSEKKKEGVIVFKLFGFIPIRKVKVSILPEEEVYVGGVPIGINVNSDGVIVMADTSYSADDGQIKEIKNKKLKSGDIITKINNKEIGNVDEVEEVLQNEKSNEVEIEFIRDNKVQKCIVPLVKSEEGYKLGIWGRDDMSGVGTLTFVHKDSHNYCGLGHAITDGQTENILPITDGKVYNCSLVGINKGQKNAPGQLKCLFLQSDESGTVSVNNKFGISGKLNDISKLVDSNLTAKVGGRLSVKPGKAKIVSSVSGLREEYEIEIIKASYQAKSDDKSLVFRVKDKKLIDLTGGIVQGMSGSPILQDGKIVGAVTHVFLSDPTKGYGVYTDWMIEECENN